jgi:hypothetical protein
MADETNSLGVLRGAAAIGKAIGASERRAYWLLENGSIPAVKEGNLWTTTIDRLRQFYAGEAANSLKSTDCDGVPSRQQG